MVRKSSYAVMLLVTVLFLMGVASCPTTPDVRRISKEELRGMLGNSDLVIIDVRTLQEWKKSDRKIVGATWEDADQYASWAGKYPRDKAIVLYCS